MKKMKLQMPGMSINDLLSREQMKKVMGGSGSGSGGVTCNCNSADDCTTWNEKCMNGCGGKPGDTYQGVCGCP